MAGGVRAWRAIQGQGLVEEVRDRRPLRELERVFRSCDMLVLKIA
jgi:hypothetical protein